jgi:hypothetical protein
MKPITRTLLKVEDNARRYFERIPFVQAFIAGIGVIIFWRGVWEWLDRSGVSPELSILLGMLLLGSVGVFIQTFIGNTIIIKSVKDEEKKEQKALQQVEGEVGTEEITIAALAAKIDTLAELISKK